MKNITSKTYYVSLAGNRFNVCYQTGEFNQEFLAAKFHFNLRIPKEIAQQAAKNYATELNILKEKEILKK